eukprot:7124755-Pyramimonas_sp.AAC.1
MFFCRGSLEAALRRALRRLQLSGVALRDWGPPPPLGGAAAIAAPCAGNGNIIDGGPEAALKLFKALQGELAKTGFVLHEEAEPAADYELDGRQIKGRRSSLIPRPRRMWR